jgi:hypothetical protein
VDGELADTGPLFWDVGGEVLPAGAVWEREGVPGLLPARLAALPAETWPRPGLAGAGGPPAPPPCYTRRPDIQPELASAAVVGGDAISFCIDASSFERTELPTCFEIDLASGAYRPRAATPYEALGRPEQEPAPVTAKIRDGKQVAVCRDGACRTIAVPELGGITASWIEATANDAASLVAVILPRDAADDDPADTSGYDKHKVAIVYDVARGRRLARIDLGEPAQKASFVGDTLLVTNDTCGGSCVSSMLVDPRTGKRIAKLGGDTPIDVTYLSAARATGDVYAFSDSSSPAIVLQDVKTGRVVRRFDHEVTGCQGPLRICMRLLDVGGRLAVVDAPGDGDSGVALYDARGKLLARHPMPVCKPASP